MLYSGLKLNPPCFYGTGRPNLTAEFHSRVNKSLQCGTRNCRPPGGRVVMMPIGTPRVAYRTPGEGNWQWIDLWNALYRERIIFLGSEVTEESSNQILGTMLYLDSVEDSNMLYFYINSAGGDITPCLAIYDTMKSLNSSIGTLCVGFAFNLAALILSAGDKGHRFSLPLATIALEPPAGAAYGRADDVQNETNELLRVRDYFFMELAKNTGQSIEKIKKDISRLKYFDAEQAIEYGLIDRLVRPPPKQNARRKEEGAGLD